MLALRGKRSHTLNDENGHTRSTRRYFRWVTGPYCDRTRLGTIFRYDMISGPIPGPKCMISYRRWMASIRGPELLYGGHLFGLRWTTTLLISRCSPVSKPKRIPDNRYSVVRICFLRLVMKSDFATSSGFSMLNSLPSELLQEVFSHVCSLTTVDWSAAYQVVL